MPKKTETKIEEPENRDVALRDDIPFPQIMEEGRPNLTYDMIRANLRQPIDPSLISQKPVGRGNQQRYVDYVNITDVKDILDDRAGLWTSVIKNTIVQDGLLLLVVSITIHAEDGDFTQDGTGCESLNYNGFGDIYSSAYAQGFRRAAEGHGLGRELWRKDEIHAAQFPERQANEAPSPRTQQPSNVSHPQPQGYTGGPQSNGRKAEPMTLRQSQFIENICNEKGWNMIDKVREITGKGLDDITKSEASKVIEQIAPK